MRLLRTRLGQAGGLQFDEFQSVPPEYAILSHAWDDGEVTFSDVEQKWYDHKAGYKKITYLLKQAAKDGLDYAWIDTCCINKTSSAVLSEAINSMFMWYREAAICYAYISDVDSTATDRTQRKQFEKSRWFTRGWTLQELLAPREVYFFSRDWKAIGGSETLRDSIATITGIDETYLSGRTDLGAASIAARMSWAAYRRTTREEDMAYCLLGLFRVNMPLLYGEGRRAFIRLQEEIIRTSDDHSIFAWTFGRESRDFYDPAYEDFHGLFATSPAGFRTTGHVFPYADWEARQPFSTTNMGLGIQFFVSRLEKEDGEHLYRATLQCPGKQKAYLCIYLRQLPGNANQFQRVRCSHIGETNIKGSMELMYVPQTVLTSERGVRRLYADNFLHLRGLQLRGGKMKRMKVEDAWSRSASDIVPNNGRWTEPASEEIDTTISRTFRLTRGPGAAVVLQLKDELNYDEYFVMFGFSDDSNIVIDLCRRKDVIPSRIALLSSDIFEPHAVSETALALDDVIIKVNLIEDVESSRNTFYADIVLLQWSTTVTKIDTPCIDDHEKAIVIDDDAYTYHHNHAIYHH